FSNKNLEKILKELIGKYTGDEELTLSDLKKRLGPNKALIFTTVNIIERQTYFLKSYKSDEENYGEWTLWQAVLASSSAPIALPVLRHVDNEGGIGYFTDGGVGSYGNPAYIAAQEAINFRGYPPEDVSVLSFGSGWVDAQHYQE